MQSFIVNIPEDKINFFLQLMEQMDFEVLDIEEDEEEEDEEEEEEEEATRRKAKSKKEAAPEQNDHFLDWDQERKNAKKNKY